MKEIKPDQYNVVVKPNLVIVRPNIADLPTSLVVELSQSKGDMQKQADILSEAIQKIKDEAKGGVQVEKC